MKGHLNIQPQHVATLRQLCTRFRRKTEVPKRGNWRARGNEDIWRHVVVQVMVVGGSSSADRFWERSALRQAVSYQKLCKLDTGEAGVAIHRVLREAGSRYASLQIAKCRKTAALVHNLTIFRKTKGDPKGLLKRLSEFTGPNEDRRRIKYVMKVLGYFNSKSSRDFLMGQGLVRDAIALDVRVVNVIRQVGVEIPDAIRRNAAVYDRVEADLLKGVCGPLGISGVVFDRIMYQNYKDILRVVNGSA